MDNLNQSQNKKVFDFIHLAAMEQNVEYAFFSQIQMQILKFD